MSNSHKYYLFRDNIRSHFREFVQEHSFGECIEYYHEIETYNETDAMLFILGVLARYGVEEMERETEFSAHLKTVAYHSGSPSMLVDLLEAAASAGDKNRLRYINGLIGDCARGLAKTVRYEGRGPAEENDKLPPFPPVRHPGNAEN